MRTAGIICECNPFHRGHGYLIDQAKASGADAVIALMSGPFVQRGDAAIVDPAARAEILLLGGADAVLELPFPYAAAGAEFFAFAGVEILERLGVDELWFGSECGDLQRLERLAAAADDPAFLESYAETVQGTAGTADAFFSCLQGFCGDTDPCLSNDILGISYLRALRKQGARMKPVTVKRQGSAYRADAVSDPNEFPSATALRRMWLERGLEAVLPYFPEGAEGILKARVVRGKAPATLSHAQRLILGQLRLADPGRLEETAELSGGLGNRLAEAARAANSLETLLQLTETKKYPLARIRRGILFALTGISREDLRSSPAYVRLLAANEKGRAFLAICRRSSSLPVITRRADLPNTPEAERQTAWAEAAYALYSLCLPRIYSCEGLWRQNPVIRGRN
ncbi:MAG: nucleotidyltransferase family protein [Clostridia bacterium]|nr:nucleotidyltransferase family protein [Clostridia bacterium]